MKLFLLSALLALFYLEVGADDYCFGKDNVRTQIRHFSSKTAYQFIKGTNMNQQYSKKGCVPQKIWMLHRHGTRLPSKKLIEKAPHLEQLRDSIVNNYKVPKNVPKKNALCKNDLKGLKKWKWDKSIKSDMANYLTKQGYKDLKGTAKTYQKYYPDLFTRKYNSSKYLFRHTDTQRTTESFKAFSKGLFGSGKTNIAEDIPEQDLLLRAYDYCELWKNLNFKGKDSESYKYRNSDIWNKTIADISKRLGFQNSLESSDVELMYDICRFEQAWDVNRPSAWCAAFLPEEVTVLEYKEDIEIFYGSGYGYDLNTRINCRAVQDMAQHLSSSKLPNVVAYFGHSTNILTLISALGFFKDQEPMLASNYDAMAQRKWKTSNIDPFASNFLAVKYQCNADPLEKEKVIFFLNQNAIDLDWCQKGLCNLSEVKKRYSTILSADCNSYACTSS